MKWKICGMREPLNINEVLTLQPDYMGFIFYPKSKRFVETNPLYGVDFGRTQKVGVFVNETKQRIMQLVTDFELDLVQLHGNETPEFAEEIYAEGIPYIKAFGVDERFNFDLLKGYSNAKFFVLDTASSNYGGSGKQFDWHLLEHYPSEIPFFLSGGIGLDDVQHLPSHPQLVGIDINSRFEIAPAQKKIDQLHKLKQYIDEI